MIIFSFWIKSLRKPTLSSSFLHTNLVTTSNVCHYFIFIHSENVWIAALLINAVDRLFAEPAADLMNEFLMWLGCLPAVITDILLHYLLY